MPGDRPCGGMPGHNFQEPLLPGTAIQGFLTASAVLLVAMSASGLELPPVNAAPTIMIQGTGSPAPTRTSAPPSSARPAATPTPASRRLVPAGNELNNREWATLFWLGALLALVLWWKETRALLGNVARIAANWKIWVPFLALVAWTAILVVLAYHIRLWTTELIRDTVIWVGSGVALYFSVTQVARQTHFFRGTALAAFKATVFIEFYVNLYVFPFLVELILLPMVTVLLMLSVIAGRDQRTRDVKALVDTLTALVGLALLAFVTVSLMVNWRQVDWPGTLRRLTLPIWLTLGLLPFLYVLSLFSNYEQAFMQLRWTSRDPRAIRRAQLALLTELNVHTRLVGKFAIPWPARLTEASSFREARRVVREYRTSMRGGKSG